MAERLHRFLVDYAGRHHDFRVARHPSESMPYLVSRVLAFALHCEEGLIFSRGVCVGDEPALFTPAAVGRMALWIDVGRPSCKKLTQGLRRAERVIVYGYGNSVPVRRSLNRLQTERMQVYWLAEGFLEKVAATVSLGTTAWQLSLEGDTISVNGIRGTRSPLLLP